MLTHTLNVTPEDADVRVDILVTKALPEVIPSRMFVKRLLDEGRLQVNGKLVKACYKVQAGDSVAIDVCVADYPDERIKPEDVALDIVYEDDALIALNKAVGIAVHPASGHYGGTLVNALVHHFGSLSDVNGAKRPGIVHRLDKETSGVLLVAKTNMAHARLAKQFEGHTIIKKYVALVEGEVQFDEGVIDAPIGEHPKYHDLRCIAREGEGKEASTRYKVVKRHKNCTAVALFPTTGRTHQLRLHMRHLRHAILGDEKYGNKGNFVRLALHAQSITFAHPLNKLLMEISVPLPAEFLPYW
ncbi:MAG: RluA family pseudouridine synthase [Candidatus Omnitrophica bacterium]|nr:RluA family pseudouridine synthase [Candidatus Omnitrophota bacterium]